MKKYWPIILILVLAAAVRIYNLTSISLWHDEAFSALMIKYPWREMFVRLGMDVHPPMYYIFLRLWSDIFGSTIWALRGFSLVFGVLTVWAVYLFVKVAFKSEKMALWAALLAALNPFQINYVTEARMYTMGAFFAVLGAYFLVRALQEQKRYYEDQSLNMPNLPQDISLQKKYLWHYLGFAVCTAIIILTHYYLLFTAAALGFYGLVYLILHPHLASPINPDGTVGVKGEEIADSPPLVGGVRGGGIRRFIPLLLSFIVIVISFLPWLKVFISQVKSVGGSYWIPPMDIWSIPGTLWTILLGLQHDNGNSLTQKLMAVAALFSIYFFWSFLRKAQYKEKWLVVLSAIAPFCGAILFVILARLKGSTTSVFEERYFLFASIFYTIALAAWLSEIKTKGVGVALFYIYAIFNLFAFARFWQDLGIATKPGMGAAAKFLGANVEMGQKVYVATSFEFFNYKYYGQTYYPIPTRPLLYTGGRSLASQMSSVEGNALLTDQDLLPDFARATHTGDTVWLLWTNGFGSQKPEVPKTWVQVDERSYSDVRPNVGTVIYVSEYKVN